MTELAFSVTDRKVTRTDTARIVGDSIDEYTAEFTLDAMWTESIITSVWVKGGEAYKAILTDGVCNVPNEVLVGYGEVTVSLYAGDLRTTVSACVWVEKSGYIEGVTPATPTPSEYAQIVEAYNSKADKADTYTETEIDAMFGGIDTIGTIKEYSTLIESLSSGVYKIDGGTLLIGNSGESIDYGIVLVSNDSDGGFINWIAAGRDTAWYYGVFHGQSVKTGEFWESTYQIVPDFGELSETIGGKQDTANKVTSIDGDSTDEQYPSAKAVIDTIVAVASYKQDKPLYFSSVAVDGWDADDTYADYPFRASIALEGVEATMLPDVVYGIAEATSGNYAPVCAAYSGGVYIYSKMDNEITIPSIKCEVVS